MSDGYQIVVCGSIVPDPLQTLEPIETPNGPALKNEMMLPAVLDPGHRMRCTRRRIFRPKYRTAKCGW